MIDDTAEGGFCGFHAYDGNGNVGQVFDAEDDSLAARYPVIPLGARETGLRDPVGREIVATGAYADANPWRLSTKYLDTVGLGQPGAPPEPGLCPEFGQIPHGDETRHLERGTQDCNGRGTYVADPTGSPTKPSRRNAT